MEKKKIAFFINSMSAGGAEKVVSLVISSLRHEFDIHLVLLHPIMEVGFDQSAAQIKIIGGNDTSGNAMDILKMPLLALRLKRYLQKEGITHCISFLNRPNFISGIARKLGWKGKIILCERVHTSSHYNKKTISGKIGQWLVRNLYNNSDLVITNAAGIAADLQENFKVRRPIKVIYNSIDLQATAIKAAEPVSDVKFDGFTFILSGRFHPQKNHPLLLVAVKQIADLPFRVLLVGKGGNEEDIRQQVAALGLQDKIIFIGFKVNPLAYVAKSQCLLMTSNYEGFPNVLLEALACGTPIISTDCLTGPRELLGDIFKNQAATDIEQLPYGMLVPVNDENSLAKAMRMVMENPTLCSNYKAAGIKRAEDFGADKTVHQFADAINGV